MEQRDQDVIRALVAEQTELWRRHEMRAWGDLFTEDCDFVTHRGIWWRGREENVVGHEDVPDDVVERKADYTQDLVSLAEVAPGVALAHTVWKWPSERREGVITLVMVRHADRWLVRAAHNTRS